MLYKFSRVQKRNEHEQSQEGIFDGKTGSVVDDVYFELGLPYFIIKWDNEKFADPTPFEMKDLKDVTYDPKHNWHQHEKDSGKVFAPRRHEEGDGSSIDKHIEKCMMEKQIVRNALQSKKTSEFRAELRNQRRTALENVDNHINSHAQELAPELATTAVNVDNHSNSHVQELLATTAARARLATTAAIRTDCTAASEFATNNLTEANRRKNLNYDARIYEVSLYIYNVFDA